MANRFVLTFLILAFLPACEFLQITATPATSAPLNPEPVSVELSSPFNLQVTGTSTSTISISWLEPEAKGQGGIAGYRVYLNGVYQTVKTSRTHQFTSLSPNTNYSLSVSAVDGAGSESERALVTRKTLADTQAPSTPFNLVVGNISANSIQLSWNQSTDTGDSGMKHYKLYQNGSLVTPVVGLTHTFTGLSPGTTFTFAVSAVDMANNESTSAEKVATTTTAIDTTPPSVPTSLVTSGITTTSISLSWNPSTDVGSGVKHYLLYKNGAPVVPATTTQTSHVFSGLSAGTSYVFAVAAVDYESNTSGQVSKAASTTDAPDTTAPTTPANLVAASITSTSVALSWTASTDAGSGVKHYQLSRNGAVVATTTNLQYIFTGLSASTTYQLKITAEDNEGNVSNPAQVQINTLPESSPGEGPERIPSFGPNGSHWPNLFPTPYPYDTSVPNVIQAAASWTDIRAKVQAITAAQANQGTLILVAPGVISLPTGSSALPQDSSGYTYVFNNAGSMDWEKRVTIAPRDGYGSVTFKSALRFQKVHKLNFAGFVYQGAVRIMESTGSSFAWSVFPEYVGVFSSDPDTLVHSLEFVEIVTPLSKAATRDAFNIYDTGGKISNVHIVGSYFASRFRTSGDAHVDTVQYAANCDPPVSQCIDRYTNMFITDTIIFGAHNGSLQTGRVNGLKIDHTMLVSGSASWARYPKQGEGVNNAINGSGENIEIKDSKISGGIAMNNSIAAQPWLSVDNTVVSNVSGSVNVPLNGSFSEDSSLPANMVLPPKPVDTATTSATDSFLLCIWRDRLGEACFP